MDDNEEMYELFPELICISDSPATWEGVITVPTDCNTTIKLKIKIIVPYYPSLDNSLVYFGHKIGFSIKNNAEFDMQIQSLLKNCESVITFLKQLQKYLSKQIDSNLSIININPIDENIRNKLLIELKSVLHESSEAEFLSTKDLTSIKILIYDISIIVEPIVCASEQLSWKIVSSDLPHLPGLVLSDKKAISLREIKNLLLKHIDMLQEFWNQMSKIDQYCWVLDPINPKPFHVYRRISISPSLSILVTINPLKPTDLPNIKFLGTRFELEKYDEALSDIIETWDPDSSVYDNLLNFLNIEEFHKPPVYKEDIDNQGIVSEEECCICFSMELDDGELPNKICNNNKCRRHFHSSCLLMWLQESAANKVVFNTIHGSCPNCGEEIDCSVLCKKTD